MNIRACVSITIPFLVLTTNTYRSFAATGTMLPEALQTTRKLTIADDEIIKAYNLSSDFFYTHHQGQHAHIGRCWTFANDTKKVQVLTLTAPGRFRGLETISVVIKPGELVSFNRKPRLWINGDGIQFFYQYVTGAQLCDGSSTHTTIDPGQVTKLNNYISQYLDDTQGSIEQKNAYQAAIRIKNEEEIALLQKMGGANNSEIVRFSGTEHLWLPIKRTPKKTVLLRLGKTAVQTSELFSLGDRLSLAINIITAAVMSGIPGGIAKLVLLGTSSAIKHLLGTQDPMAILATLRTILEKRHPLENSTAALIVRCINIIESSTGQTYKDKQSDVVRILREKLQSIPSHAQRTLMQRNQRQRTNQAPYSNFDWHQGSTSGAGRCWIFTNNTITAHTLTLYVPHRLYGSKKISITVAPLQLVSFNRKPYIIPFSNLGLHTYVLGGMLRQSKLTMPETKKLNEYIAHHLDDTRGSRENPLAATAAIVIENDFSLRLHQNALGRTIENTELVRFENGYYLFLPIKTIQRRPLHAHITEPMLATAKEVAMPLSYSVWNYSLSPLWYASGKFADLFMSFSGNQNFDRALQKVTELLQDIEGASRPQREHISNWLCNQSHNNPSPIEALTLKEKRLAQQSIQDWMATAHQSPLYQTNPDLLKKTLEYGHAAIAGLG